jgi:hypothetical protein
MRSILNKIQEYLDLIISKVNLLSSKPRREGCRRVHSVINVLKNSIVGNTRRVKARILTMSMTTLMVLFLLMSTILELDMSLRIAGFFIAFIVLILLLLIIYKTPLVQ